MACGEDDSNPLRISFKVNGSSVSYEHSFLDSGFGDNPFGAGDVVGAGIIDATTLFAQPVSTYLSSDQPDDYVFIDFEDLTNADGSFNEATNGDIEYQKNGNTYDTEAFSLIITEYGEVGELIKGTFTATVSYGGETNEITAGLINVVRLTNGAF